MSVTKRIETARGHWYRLDGEKVDGVTTVISNGIPKPALMPWAAKEVATFAADHLDLLAELDREARIDLLKGAHFRERDRAARRGTEVHNLAEKIMNGEEVAVPEELLGHVDSYIKFLDEFDPKPILVEAVVGHRAHKWMGTIDFLATIDGRVMLIDIKTTRSGIFGEVALQLAAYRNAEFYLDGTTEHPMPKADECAALWVRADGYDLVPVEAGPEVYRAFRYAQMVAHWQTVTSKTVVGDVTPPPQKGHAA